MGRVDRWQAYDGKEFMTEQEQLFHDITITTDREARVFLQLVRPEINPTKLTEYLKIIQLWELHKHGELPEEE